MVIVDFRRMLGMVQLESLLRRYVITGLQNSHEEDESLRLSQRTSTRFADKGYPYTRIKIMERAKARHQRLSFPSQCNVKAFHANETKPDQLTQSLAHKSTKVSSRRY